MREMKQRTIEEETKWGVRAYVCGGKESTRRKQNAVRRMKKL
jgi:hypothetical protein